MINLDPELHQLRSIGRTLPPRESRDFESARYHLYAAITANRGDAWRWVDAMDTALRSYVEDDVLRANGMRALAAIRDAINAA